MSYVLVWEYRVAREASAAFEDLYGSGGGWVRLFSLGPGFLGTELLRDAHDGLRYLTIDRWESADAFAAFREAHAGRYRVLDAEGERLTEAERFVGAFGGAGAPT
jgi:heme-degrading monooxygenase HmoA